MIPYVYNAVIESVVDGDSFHATISLGFGLRKSSETSMPGVLMRLADCNARELEQPGGPEARDNLATLLPPGTWVILQTVKPDKFGGRYDALVQLPDGRDLTAVLIAQQFAVRWDGKGERPVPPWPRPLDTQKGK